MTRLEQLGLEVAAENLMHGQRGLGRLLATLLIASPKTVSHADLMNAKVQDRDKPPAPKSVAVRIAHLRRRLEDLGYSRTIIISVYEQGYRINKPDADLLLAALKEAA